MDKLLQNFLYKIQVPNPDFEAIFLGINAQNSDVSLPALGTCYQNRNLAGGIPRKLLQNRNY